MQITHRPIILIIMDGWGYSDSTTYNAVHSANKPAWEDFWSIYPHMLLRCSGSDVGLPDGQMGNSEVGHMHMGAGRVVEQDFTRIKEAIEDRSFFENEMLINTIDQLKKDGKALHLLGLLSPGGVHSHEDHILAMIELAASRGLKDICLHAFLDGRDTPPKSANESIRQLQAKFSELGVGRFASIIGRFYAMDRNNIWDRTQASYDLIVNGTGEFSSSDPYIALDKAYVRGETDEFVKATAIVPHGTDPVQVEDGDVVLFMNYRADRARQLTRAFIDNKFKFFERDRKVDLSSFVSLTQYSADFDIPAAFPPHDLKNVFGKYISDLGLRQLRIAETEKYAHVTFFFNGGEERVFDGEDRILVPSPHVATYDEQPEMSAQAVTDRMVEAIYGLKYDVIICNFANPDMVGHTGNFEAAVKAVETVDSCIDRIVASAQSIGGEILITADHGNAERMRSIATKMDRGVPYTSHTTSPVPLVYIGRPASMANSGTLTDLSPTMLHLMGIEIPPEMTGTSLVKLESENDSGQESGVMRRRLSKLMG